MQPSYSSINATRTLPKENPNLVNTHSKALWAMNCEKMPPTLFA